jgi:hypothetical protein
MNFDDADGDYTFSGPINLTGIASGIDIKSGSEGSFTFSGATTIDVGGPSPSPSLHGIDIQDNLNTTFNFSDTLNINSSAGSGINIANTGGEITFGSGMNSGAVNAPSTSGVAAVNIDTQTNSPTTHDLTVNFNGMAVNGSAGGPGIAVAGVTGTPVNLNISDSAITGGDGGVDPGGGAGIGGAGGSGAGVNGTGSGGNVNIVLNANTTITGGAGGSSAGGGAGIGGGGGGSGVTTGGTAGANTAVTQNGATISGGLGGGGTAASSIGASGNGT